MSFTITLPPPISANRYWATRVINPKAGGRAQAMTYVTPEAKAYKERVGWLLKAAGVRAPIEGRSIGPVFAKRAGMTSSKRRIARHVDAGMMDLFEPTKNETLLREQQGL